VAMNETCSFCRTPPGATRPIVGRAIVKSKPIFICQACDELASKGFSGTAVLFIRYLANAIFAELWTVNEIRQLLPRLQFRIRSYMIGVAILAALLCVPVRDTPVLLLFAAPAVAKLGERWLMSQGCRQMASWLVGFYLLPSLLVGLNLIAVILFDSVQRATNLVADSSPYTLTLVGAIWTCSFVSMAVSGVGRQKTERLAERATSE